MEKKHILQMLEEKRESGLAIISKQLAKILQTDEDTLDYVNKCWGYGYVFIKKSSNDWQIKKDVYVDEEWFINVSLA